MFGISGTELGIILLFALLVFGPDKLPQLGRTVGRFMNEFKKAQESVEATIKAEMYKSDAEQPAVETPAFSHAASDVEDEEEEDEE